MDHVFTHRGKPPKPVKPVKPTNLKASTVTESARNPRPTVDAPAGQPLDLDRSFEGLEIPEFPNVIVNPVKYEVLGNGSSPPIPLLSKNSFRRASPSMRPATISHVAESIQPISVPIPSQVQSELDEVDQESRELAERQHWLNLRRQRLEEERQEQEKTERERAPWAVAGAEREGAERREADLEQLERQEEVRQMLQRLHLENQRDDREEHLGAEQLRLGREKLIQQQVELQKQEELLRKMEQTFQRNTEEDEPLAKRFQRQHINLQKTLAINWWSRQKRQLQA